MVLRARTPDLGREFNQIYYESNQSLLSSFNSSGFVFQTDSQPLKKPPLKKRGRKPQPKAKVIEQTFAPQKLSLGISASQ